MSNLRMEEIHEHTSQQEPMVPLNIWTVIAVIALALFGYFGEPIFALLF